MVTRTDEVHLTCGCQRRYSPPPVVGDLVYCPRHPRSTSRVTTVMGATWAARCQERCRYSRTFGMDETEAYAAASRHATKHGGHVVEVSKGGELMAVIVANKQGALFEAPVSHAEPRSQRG